MSDQDRRGPVGSRVDAVADGVRSFVSTSDARLLLVFALTLYGLFTVVSVLLGYNFNGIVDTLRRITFLSGVYAILVLALNVQWGYAGLFNIGVAGFMAVGVYTMAILSSPTTNTFPGLGLPLPIGIVGGVLAATVLGLLAALPALRLRGDYLAIVTLAMAEIVRRVFRSPVFQEFSIGSVQLGTGGSRGMNLPENPIRTLFYQNPGEAGSPPNGLGSALFDAASAAGIEPSVVEGWVYATMLVVAVGLVYWLLRRVGNSPFGRVLKAVREDEVVARALGKDTRLFKVKAFAVGCALMGLGGILWRLSGGYVSTTMFQPIYTFYVFVALIIGGAGSNTGSILGGAAFASLLFEGPNFVRRIVTGYVDVGAAPNSLYDAIAALGGLDLTPLVAYSLSDVNVSALRLVLLGVVLIYLIQNRPEGLLGHRKEVASPIDLTDRGTEEGDG